MQTAAEPSLRQMVELYAEQNNLDFVPKSGRREQGLQVSFLLHSSPPDIMTIRATVLHEFGTSWKIPMLWGCNT